MVAWIESVSSCNTWQIRRYSFRLTGPIISVVLARYLPHYLSDITMTHLYVVLCFPSKIHARNFPKIPQIPQDSTFGAIFRFFVGLLFWDYAVNHRQNTQHHSIKYRLLKSPGQLMTITEKSTSKVLKYPNISKVS